jgi:hypothetical protein
MSVRYAYLGPSNFDCRTLRERPVLFKVRKRKASWSFQKTTVCAMCCPTVYRFGHITNAVTAAATTAKRTRIEIAFFLSKITLPRGES